MSVGHLSLERQVITELNPFAAGISEERHQTVRRETVLALLSRSAQLSPKFCELLNEAGLLTASSLEMEFFGCAEVLRLGVLRIAWGSVSESSRNVEPVHHDVGWDGGRNAFAFALDAGHPVVIADSTTEDRFEDPLLLDNRVKSGIICPINYREQQYGAVGIFSPNSRPITKEDVLFVQSTALLLGPTRAHQRTEETLAEHSRFLSSAIDSLEALVVLMNADGGILQINRACQSISRFGPEQLRSRQFWSAFFLPADEARVRSKLNDLRLGTQQSRFDAFFLTKRGEQRRVGWTFARLNDGVGEEGAILATGIDITEQYGVMAKLEQGDEEPKVESDSPKVWSTEPAAASSAAATSKVQEDDGMERRRNDRRPYRCIQYIAPCNNGKLPGREEFIAAQCYDISPRGFSFLSSSKPDFQELVVAFGADQSRLFLRARVVHTTPFREHGRNILLVGCEYLARVRLPWMSDNFTHANS